MFPVSMGGNGRSGKSAADRIKLSATARDIPSEPPRKSLESFAGEDRFSFFSLSIHCRDNAYQLLRRAATYSLNYRYWYAHY